MEANELRQAPGYEEAMIDPRMRAVLQVPGCEQQEMQTIRSPLHAVGLGVRCAQIAGVREDLARLHTCSLPELS